MWSSSKLTSFYKFRNWVPHFANFIVAALFWKFHSEILKLTHAIGKSQNKTHLAFLRIPVRPLHFASIKNRPSWNILLKPLPSYSENFQYCLLSFAGIKMNSSFRKYHNNHFILQISKVTLHFAKLEIMLLTFSSVEIDSLN